MQYVHRTLSNIINTDSQILRRSTGPICVTQLSQQINIYIVVLYFEEGRSETAILQCGGFFATREDRIMTEGWEAGIITAIPREESCYYLKRIIHQAVPGHCRDLSPIPQRLLSLLLYSFSF